MKACAFGFEKDEKDEKGVKGVKEGPWFAGQTHAKPGHAALSDWRGCPKRASPASPTANKSPSRLYINLHQSNPPMSS